MPLEIKELHIKVAVEEPSSGQPAPAQGSQQSQEALIKALVDKVLEILKERMEK